ncbi:uncharacterized protein PgNI_01157 [Pyricularia grisea]|uniref:Uncharacterized protein n=1 Tax=Pyricularia grisea TaxID=148305 RepID=A0A6P8BIU3_PYRGI|nr:uncharacterized protein PgNI_01157 [Pyricularia grisea]TLD16630.1 hypothetical protein PgNI_01157 [Pyricularia grisea]
MATIRILLPLNIKPQIFTQRGDQFNPVHHRHDSIVPVYRHSTERSQIHRVTGLSISKQLSSHPHTHFRKPTTTTTHTQTLLPLPHHQRPERHPTAQSHQPGEPTPPIGQQRREDDRQALADAAQKHPLPRDQPLLRLDAVPNPADALAQADQLLLLPAELVRVLGRVHVEPLRQLDAAEPGRRKARCLGKDPPDAGGEGVSDGDEGGGRWW